MSDDVANAGSADDLSVGSRLRQARIERGLALEQAAEDMRLAPEVLSALEADDFEILGAQVFVRGHLRQYAALLGLDADDLMGRYATQDHPSDDPIVTTESIRGRYAGELGIWIALGAGLLLVVALLVWWQASPEEEKAVPVVATEVDPVPVPTTPAVTAAPPAEEQSAPDATIMSDVVASEQAPTPVVERSNDEVVEEPTLPAADTWSVEVVFEEDSWVEIIGGDDRRLFYGLGRAGARSRFEASAPLSVLFGNADGVRIVVNGSVYPVPIGARQGNLARFVIAEAP